MTRVSVVVPTKDSSRTLESCLRAVRAQSHPNLELIVVDNHSSDDTVSIAQRYADIVETWGPERSAQRNRGFALSSGELVVFLDSDQNLTPDVLRQAVEAVGEDQQLGALVIPEEAFGDGFFAACRALEKSLYLGDSTVEAARIFTRKALDAVGGYDESLHAGEDWELPDRVRKFGLHIGRVHDTVRHDEGRVKLLAQFNKKRYYGRSLFHYYRTAPEPRPISRTALLAHPRLLAAKPLHTTGLLALKTAEAAGILAGVLEARRADAKR